MLRRSGAGDRITIRVSVAEAEQLLGTRYSVYRHPDTDSYIVRTVSYSLPSILHEHVDLVTPTTYFGNMLPMKSTHFLEPASNNFQALTGAALVDTVAADCNIVITPRCLRALYKTENYTASAYPQNTLGVAGYLEEYANRADFKVG
jgi:tripeptidyl-peptidase-1